MGTIKIVAIALIVSGLLGLLYGGFSYTRETQEAKIGTLELSVKDTQTVFVPVWASVAAIVAGSGFLLFASRKT
jgi:TRAP-type C4-dicarboxylate transport system permease small subunit